jgi:hypothetical protein
MNLEDLDNRLAAPTREPAGTPAFEFQDWMAFLDRRDCEFMILHFVEEWEHETAAVFNLKKKLARHLKSRMSRASPSEKRVDRCCRHEQPNYSQGGAYTRECRNRCFRFLESRRQHWPHALLLFVRRTALKLLHLAGRSAPINAAGTYAPVE